MKRLVLIGVPICALGLIGALYLTGTLHPRVLAFANIYFEDTTETIREKLGNSEYFVEGMGPFAAFYKMGDETFPTLLISHGGRLTTVSIMDLSNVRFDRDQRLIDGEVLRICGYMKEHFAEKLGPPHYVLKDSESYRVPIDDDDPLITIYRWTLRGRVVSIGINFSSNMTIHNAETWIVPEALP
jgi:hypothetical protein